MAKQLPPFGRRYLDAPPSAGLVVAIGPGSWHFAQAQGYTVIVLPPGDSPDGYRWPTNAYGALVQETGPADDDLLAATAIEILRAGCPYVVAIRHSQLACNDCRHFFYPDGADVVAA
jgi:hypothetical protein